MSFQTIPLFPLSGLNLDNTPSLLKPGEYVNALDVTHISEKGGTQYRIHNFRGNELVFSIPAATAQNKVYRIPTVAGTSTHILSFRRTDGVQFTTATFTEGATIAITKTNLASAIAAAITFFPTYLALIPQQQFTLPVGNANDAFMDFTLITVTGYDYSIQSIILTTETLIDIPIIKEAISADLTGEMNLMGSWDLLGDLFLWSTPQKNLISTLPLTITNATNTTPIVLTTSAAHGISVGQQIKVSNVLGSTGANGVWIVTATTLTTITLGNSVAGGVFLSSPLSTIQINLTSLGEVGVAQKNINDNTWQYIRLIRTREFALRLPKQITGAHAERTGFNISIYWTDDFNVPRAFYYKGVYIDDGAIKAINPAGQYAYGSIHEETKLIISQINAKLTFTSQLNGGGNLTSGNKRYAFRFIGETNVGTAFSDVTNPISVFVASTTQDFEKILGNDDKVSTSKINVLTITGIIPGLFKFVELAVIEYNGEATNASTLPRILLGNATTIEIQHTGFEINIPISTAKIDVPVTDYVQAKSMNVIDKRMILSNVKTQKQYDLSAWARTIKYRLKQEPITGVGELSDIRFGEYLNPANVNKFVGYMHNETYRFGVKLKFKNGGWTQDYFVDDILFVAGGTLGQRLAGLPNYNLSINTPSNINNSILVPFIEFTNIDFDFILEDGLKIREVFDEISFERADCINEVLATGALILSVFGSGTDYFIPESYFNDTPLSGANNAFKFGVLHSAEHLLGNVDLAFKEGDRIKNIGMPNPANPAIITRFQDYTGIIASLVDYQEIILKDSKLIATGGTGILTNVAPAPLSANLHLKDRALTITTVVKSQFRININDVFPNNFDPPSTTTLFSTTFSYSPHPNATIVSTMPTENTTLETNVDNLDIDRAIQTIQIPTILAINIANAPSITVNTKIVTQVMFTDNLVQQANSFSVVQNTSVVGDTFPIGITATAITTFTAVFVITGAQKRLIVDTTTTTTINIPGIYNIYKGYGLSLLADPISSDPFDEGIYYIQYFRPKANKYPTLSETKYITCGHSLTIDKDSALSTTTKVFGGDTFTQKWYVHSQYGKFGIASGAGYGFYCQNRVNTQLRLDGILTPAIPGQAGGATISIKVQKWIDILSDQETRYSKSYTPQNSFKHAAFDLTAEQIITLLATIAFSDLKVAGGVQDNYRIFFPLNKTDLDLSFGEIIHHTSFNGELVTIQLRKYMRQYFNARGTLQTIDESEVILGTGAALSRDGQTITQYGSDNKFSIINGKSKGGDDVLYWINTDLKKAIRFGRDGTKPISDENNMQAFFANNLRFVTGKDNPASGEGICGVWDDRNSEVIWTFRGHKSGIAKWTALNPGGYIINNIVSFGTTNFEQTPDFYKCIQAHPFSNEDNQPPNILFWKKIPHTDNDFYNEYTLVFNEDKNAFTAFYTFKPKIYLKWRDIFLSPRPISSTGNVYEHHRGNFAVWYDTQQSEPFIELIFAADENMAKEFVAIFASSDVVPKRMEFTTAKHKTFIIDTDFENDLDRFVAAIKTDVLTSSNGQNNDENTSNLWGQYIKIKVFFETSVAQSFLSIVLKWFQLYRSAKT